MIKLGDKIIGPGHKPFVIAECCNNFQGSMDIAMAMISRAAKCGADAVKFQYRRGQADRIQLAELAFLQGFCKPYNIPFLCTAYTPEGVDEIDPLVMAHKIGSAEVTDLEFVRHVASKERPIIWSTGACRLQQCYDVMNTLGEVGFTAGHVALQCTSIYPTPPNRVRLGVMNDDFARATELTGYSDHTGQIEYPIAAMTLGADVVEVHFTLSRNLPGPDQACSHEPEALKRICDFAREREQVLRGGKECFPEELEKISQFRKPI